MVLPTEIQKLIADQEAIIALCDSERAKLEATVAALQQRKKAAQETIAALNAKWATPTLDVWSTGV